MAPCGGETTSGRCTGGVGADHAPQPRERSLWVATTRDRALFMLLVAVLCRSLLPCWITAELDRAGMRVAPEQYNYQLLEEGEWSG